MPDWSTEIEDRWRKDVEDAENEKKSLIEAIREEADFMIKESQDYLAHVIETHEYDDWEEGRRQGIKDACRILLITVNEYERV